MITSLENSKIKYLIKLKNKKYRNEENKFLVEGLHLIKEAAKANVLEEVYSIEELDIPSTLVTEEVMKKICGTDTICKAIGVCKKINNSELIGNKYLLLDEIQDPGNLGTIIRSALAFNIDTIVLGNNTVDLYNEKVLRSTQGSIFYLNIIEMNLELAIERLHKKNIKVYGTDVINGIDVNNVVDKEKYAVIMGNEGNGVNESLKNLCDQNIYIKTNNNSESLNVAMATTVILYELDK